MTKKHITERGMPPSHFLDGIFHLYTAACLKEYASIWWTHNEPSFPEELDDMFHKAMEEKNLKEISVAHLTEIIQEYIDIKCGKNSDERKVFDHFINEVGRGYILSLCGLADNLSSMRGGQSYFFRCYAVAGDYELSSRSMPHASKIDFSQLVLGEKFKDTRLLTWISNFYQNYWEAYINLTLAYHISRKFLIEGMFNHIAYYYYEFRRIVSDHMCVMENFKGDFIKYDANLLGVGHILSCLPECGTKIPFHDDEERIGSHLKYLGDERLKCFGWVSAHLIPPFKQSFVELCIATMDMAGEPILSLNFNERYERFIKDSSKIGYAVQDYVEDRAGELYREKFK